MVWETPLQSAPHGDTRFQIVGFEFRVLRFRAVHASKSSEVSVVPGLRATSRPLLGPYRCLAGSLNRTVPPLTHSLSCRDQCSASYDNSPCKPKKPNPYTSPNRYLV